MPSVRLTQEAFSNFRQARLQLVEARSILRGACNNPSIALLPIGALSRRRARTTVRAKFSSC